MSHTPKSGSSVVERNANEHVEQALDRYRRLNREMSEALGLLTERLARVLDQRVDEGDSNAKAQTTVEAPAYYVAVACDFREASNDHQLAISAVNTLRESVGL